MALAGLCWRQPSVSRKIVVVLPVLRSEPTTRAGDVQVAFPETERVVYEQNTLEEVKCQIRFPPILAIEASVPANFQEAVRAAFPYFELKTSVRLPAGIPAGIAQVVERDLAAYYPWLAILRMGPMQAAILGLGLNYGSYEAEVYRAGIASIPVGQWEAAASLGMAGPLTFRRIILPQAIRTILPPMTNDFVALFKDTSIVSTIAVVELSKQYQILSKSSMKYLEIGLLTAALYLLMSVPLGLLSRRLERIWGRGIL